MHETLLVPILIYDSGTMIWKEKERSRITAVKMDSFRCLLGIRKKDKVWNVWIRK